MNEARFRLGASELSAEPYRYTACGLDDIFLLNGFTVHATEYGRGVAVERADELHREIGLYLIHERKILGPKDIRFLRKEMDMTQEELGQCLGVTGQTIARYEKSYEITGPADRLLRVLYAFHLLPEDQKTQVLKSLMDRIKELSGLDDRDPHPIYFGTNNGAWDEAHALAAA